MPYDPELHGPERIVGPGFHEKVYRVVRKIPKGRVSTFGDVAAALGKRSVARQVAAEQFAAGMQSLSREQYVVLPTHELPTRVEASASRVSSRANTRPMPARSRISPSESVRL